MTRALHNKALVIIGGTTGLGLSAAHAFLKASAHVVCVGRNRANVDAARKALGTRARVLTGDATLPGAVDRAIRAALREFGRFDGLYHVAGGSGRRHGDGPLHELTEAGWAYTLNLNLTSQFLSNRAAVRQFLKQNSGGSVLNVGSVLAEFPSPKHFATHAYAAAKAAIIGMSRSSAAYYAHANIRFNVLEPALVATPMSRRAQANPDILHFMKTKQPLDGGRIGHPSDLDAAAVYFMSDASRFTTGQVLAVDGGWSVAEGQWIRG